MDDVLHPGEVGVTRGRDAVGPALVFAQQVAAPVADVERGVREDEVCLEVGMAVGMEAVAVGDLAVDAADRQIHLRQPPRRVVRLLAVDADVAEPTAVRRDELL